MKKIANLEVFVDEHSDEPTSLFSPVDRFDNLNYSLVISPKDGELLSRMGIMNAREVEDNLPTRVAHELGHFILSLTGRYNVHTYRRDPRPEERDAWTLAEKMLPELNQTLKEGALNSYERSLIRAYENFADYQR